MMSQSKLEKVLPLIQSAAKIFVNDDGISEAEEYETKAFCQQFTVKAIMSSGFNIGKAYHTVHTIRYHMSPYHMDLGPIWTICYESSYFFNIEISSTMKLIQTVLQTNSYFLRSKRQNSNG